MKINPFHKISIILVLIWIFRANSLFFVLLKYNLGIPELRYQKFFFVVLPMIYLLGRSLKGKHLYAPSLIKISIMILLFVFIEKIHYSSPEYDIVNRWLWIYLLFFILYNLVDNFNVFIYTFKIAFNIIFFNAIVLLLAFTGLIKFPFVGYDVSGRLLATFNLNNFADISALGITILLIYLFLIKETILTEKNLWKFFILFTLVPIFSATRGASIIIALSLFYYFLYRYNKISFGSKIFIFFITFILLTIFSQLIFESILKLTLTQRIENSDISKEGRALQIFASWYNFLKSPFIGNGYKYAATGIIENMSRSNFQYTQILASSGIIFGLYYFYVISKFITVKMKYLFSPEIFLIFLFIFTLFLFRRPDIPFAFLFYISNSLIVKFNKVSF